MPYISFEKFERKKRKVALRDAKAKRRQLKKAKLAANLGSTDQVKRWRGRFGFLMFLSLAGLCAAFFFPFDLASELSSELSLPIIVSFVSLVISMFGFITTAYFSWRTDQQRARQAHEWDRSLPKD